MAKIDALDDDIVKTATTILRRRHASNLTPYCNRRFRSLFGVDPNIVTLLWVEKQHNLEETVVAHLLWALMFLKLYATETVHAALAWVDENTFRKWAWSWIEHLAHLETADRSRVGFSLATLHVYSPHRCDHTAAELGKMRSRKQGE
ncbi:hypothetical protein H257_17522 [Aphanomyces astaci]|uniref:Uncharacterized protein n=1 Tax=Aphanomyces astaci TaxID=112090 RepID=W4FGB0_APHAT|nr:hypothetical protein H257_17522 [Aphanomyces astaci]ETV65881.1 hypothetical protein H257_17522 [Aphanomyces astaci]|eukprot:XP_009844634.1 hypothetical protein H257_17522 [Aphanomyces astaci]